MLTLDNVVEEETNGAIDGNDKTSMDQPKWREILKELLVKREALYKIER